jgi:DivIVA domain-containing protein
VGGSRAECDDGPMAAENPTDVLPMLTDANPGFAVAMRGYDRSQVDQFLGRMDEDLRATIAERDAIGARTADLAAQLASAHAQIESLRRQLRTANEAVTADNIDERVRARLEAANAEAAKIRSAAEDEANAIRTGAADAAACTRGAATAEADEILAQATQRHLEADDTFRRRLADADQHRARVEEQLAQSMAQAQADEDRLTMESEAVRVRLDAEAQAERDRLDAESLARRAQAEEDFEVTLRLRRTAEAELSAEQKATAETEAAQTVAAARAKAAKLVDQAAAEVRRLYRDRADVHAQLEQLHNRLGALLAEGKDSEPRSAPEAQPTPLPDPRAQ